MFYSNVLFVLVVSGCLCSISNSGIIEPKGAFSSHVNDDDRSLNFDCSRFKNDLDVLRHFPFSVVVLPEDEMEFRKSSAYLNQDGTTIGKIYIRREVIVPPHVFCLSKLTRFFIDSTPFPNDMIPDALGKLKALRFIDISEVPMKKLPKQLTSLANLTWIGLKNCSLTYLPDLTNLENLAALVADDNQILKIGALPPLRLLYLSHNRLTEIPRLEKPELLQALAMGHNPLKNAEPALLYKNLELLSLANATLTTIPQEIDQFKKLEHLDVSSNQLTTLPMSILDLPQLESIYLNDNQFSPDDIKSIQETLETSRPSIQLKI